AVLTGFPFASASCTTGCCANATLLTAVALGCVVMRSLVAAVGAVPVAENVTLSAPDVAFNALGPGVAPSVHEPIVAIPELFVVAGPPVIVPHPLRHTKLTAA